MSPYPSNDHNNNMIKQPPSDTETSITASFGCLGCLISLAVIIFACGLGVYCIRLAIAFFKWCWESPIF